MLEYTAATTNATNKIVATPKVETAEVEIESDDATIADDGTATWSAGANLVTITVTDVVLSKTYKVTVTKS